MSIIKEKNGSYTVRWRVKDINTGKTMRKAKRGFALKREAVEFEKSIDSRINSVTSKDMTFREISVEMESYNNTSEVMKRKHQEILSKRFNKYADKDIREFTRPMLVKWQNYIQELDYSTATKNNTISFIKQVFKYANMVYDIPNPAVVLRMLKKSDEEIMHEMKTWTPNEFKRFIACVDNPIFHAYFNCLYWTGMRKGEAIALSVADLKDGWINIHSSQRDAAEGRKTTKTKQTRKIRIDDDLNTELLSISDGVSKHYLFGGSSSLSRTTIDRVFQKAIDDAGVQPIRIHDLRHSHATWLINNGANIVAVSRRLGHASIEQTLKTYTHLLDSTDDAMMSIIEKEKKKSK